MSFTNTPPKQNHRQLPSFSAQNPTAAGRCSNSLKNIHTRKHTSRVLWIGAGPGGRLRNENPFSLHSFMKGMNYSCMAEQSRAEQAYRLDWITLTMHQWAFFGGISMWIIQPLQCQGKCFPTGGCLSVWFVWLIFNREKQHMFVFLKLEAACVGLFAGKMIQTSKPKKHFSSEMLYVQHFAKAIRQDPGKCHKTAVPGTWSIILPTTDRSSISKTLRFAAFLVDIRNGRFEHLSNCFELWKKG